MPQDGPSFSPEPLQNIVERLASIIQRSVAVDDADLRLLAHSTHFGDEDPARIRSLVGRFVTDEIVEWARRTGVMRATAPFFTPSAPELGLRPRYVAPIRVDRELAAVLWIIDDGTLSINDLAAVDSAVDNIRTVLVRRAMSFEDDIRQMEAQILGLLSDRSVDRQEAVEELHAAGTFRGCVAYQVINVHVKANGREQRSTGSSIPLRVIERALTQRASGTAVARTDQATVVVIGYAAAPAADQLVGVSEAVLRAVDSVGDALEGIATVGMGGVVAELERAVESHEQAELAIRIARSTGARSFDWADAKLDGMIAALLPEQVPSYLLPRRMIDALENQSEENLLAIRSYLYNAGNVVKTCEELHVHRTTVYYRLTRFTESTGLDLEDGDTRLMVHLWFRMQSFVDVKRA
jgi:hypothetical protein